MMKQAAGFAAGTGITVGHEARALFVARGDVADPGVGQAAIQFDSMHAGNAEDGVDAIVFEDLDQNLATGFH